MDTIIDFAAGQTFGAFSYSDATTRWLLEFSDIPRSPELSAFRHLTD